MFCGNCGTKLTAELKFCTNCGMPCNSVSTLGATKKAKRKNKTPIIIVMLILILGVGFAFGYLSNGEKQQNPSGMHLENSLTTPEALVDVFSEDNELRQQDATALTQFQKFTGFEGSGYTTPEEAVVAYLDAMKCGDVYGMIETFAVETYVKYYNIKKHIESISSYTPKMNQRLVNENRYAQSLNEIIRLEKIAGYWDDQFLYMTGYTDRYDLHQTIGPIKEDEVAGFVDFIKEEEWMNMLAELEYGNVLVKEEVAQIDSVLADKMDTALPNFQNTLTHKQQIGGYDELAWTITGFTFNGENYYLCMDVACYDGVWYNYEPGGLCGSYLGVDTYYAGVILQSEY